MPKKKKKGRRKISAKKVKENLEKKQFQHPYIVLPEGMDFFRAEFPKDKTTKTYYLNIIPFEAGKHSREAEEGELWWRTKYSAAKKVGPDEVQVASPISIGKKCPIQEAFEALEADPDVDDDDIKDLRPKSREMYYVQDTKDESGKVWLLDISYFLFGKKLDEELRSEDGEDYLAFADVEDGHTLKLRFKQNTFGKATYQEVDKIDFVTRKGDEITDEMIDELKDPMAFIKFLSYDEIKAVMEGEEEDEIPMEHEGDKDRKRKARGTSGKKKKKPAKKKKKKTDAGAVLAALKKSLGGMDRGELKSVIKEEGLSVKVVKSKKDSQLRKEIIACMVDEPQPDEEEDW